MSDGGDGGTILAGPWNGTLEIAPPIDPPCEAPPQPPNSEAWNILQEAANLIEGDRNDQHGAREKCHAEIAKLWTWWTGFQIDPHDVAVMMAMLKIARIKTGSYNRDSYLDACGYLSIAGELRNGQSR